MAVDDDQPGIAAYHGSPHEFNEFDSSKIGTGEGAQAYGHGLYFAEHEPVAKSYKDKLTGKSTEVEFPNGDTDDFGKPLRWHPDSLDDKIEAAAARAVLSYSGSLGQKQVIRQHLDNSKDAANAMRLIKNKEIYPAAPGYMYKVAINAHPDHFLDWDKPLSEQHPNVQNALKHSFGLSPHALDYWRNSLVDDNAENGPTYYPQHRLNEIIDEMVSYGGYGEKFGHNVFEELKKAAPKLADEFIDVVKKQTHGGISPTDPGSALWRGLENNKGPEKASQALHAAGVSGIKYLDGNSRGQGEGTKNYVVFDPKIVEIKNRYAEGGFIHDPEKAKRRSLMIARGFHKAEGGIASITSPDPEMREAAKRIAQTTYKVPTDTTFKGSSYFGVKPPMGASDVKATVDPIPGLNTLPEKLLTWDDFYKQAQGGTLIALGGDRSRLGRLTHINGKELAWPVDLHAGVDYMLEPNEDAVWANAAGHSSRLNKLITELLKRGPVYGAYNPMGPKSVDSSFQMTDAVLSQIASDKPDKTSMKLFDEAIKNGFYVGGQREEDVADRLREKNRMKDWPGINNTEEAKEFIKNNMPGAPRSLLMKYMDKAGWTKLGFPHIGVTRVAITKPELLNVGGNMMGHRIVELNSNPVSNLSFEHNTYPEVTGGKYVGDVPLVQRHYGAPDVIDQFAANPRGKVRPIIMHPYSLDPGARSGAGKMFEVQKAQQPINERMINEIGKGLELQSQYGFADGGEVDNNELLNTADRLGVDKSNIPALNETKKMIEFHSRLGDEIQKRSQANAEIVAEHRELGNLPLDVGTRFSTEHSRANNLPPFLVTGYYVNSKDPANNYGYHVSRNHNDGLEETVVSVKNPILEKQKTPEEWEDITKGFKPMMGPKSIKSTGGPVEGDIVRRALTLTRQDRR